ncbi:Glutathione peroxidase [Paragonimus heterotremus]|uniref:Glutathione peroxidase n=1 Tax=Paragonimus heterotremus TaxID=100268 RepID=A0A8J4SPX5_9TREM|nr:Glutathione peroxidase [Paragonimus heterotremus]
MHSCRTRQSPVEMKALPLLLCLLLVINCQPSSIYDFTVIDVDGNPISLDRYRGKYADRGLRVLAFPCNQFGGQEPDSDAEIKQYVMQKYNVTFDLFHKIDVNGPNAIPLYEYLKSQHRGPLFVRRIEWNYVKFLVDRNGVPYDRYSSVTEPNSMLNAILRLLGP